MELTRRRFWTGAGAVGAGALAGCIGSGTDGDDGEPSERTAQSSFFVFDSLATAVAGDAADAELLVPVGQHGHGWEPGPRVREDIRDAALLVHGMEGFQPWIDDITADLAADGADVATVDASSGVSLLGADGDGHDHEAGDDHDHGDVDPHFWMDPLRVGEAVDTVAAGFEEVDPENDAYAANAEDYRSRLEDLHGRIESTVAAGSTDVLLVAGHNAYGYLADRYGVEIRALTGLSPDDRPTTSDIERAQEAIETHDIRYICADPLEPQEAAMQLLEDTDAEEVLPLTAMPGLTDEWAGENWGYLDVMENVNLPTLETALDA